MIIKPPRIQECVPLCGADASHGPNAPWWRHSTLCPARKSRQKRRTPDNVECQTTWPDHEHCAHWRAFGDCCHCHSETCSIPTPEEEPMCPTCGGDGNARPFLGKHTPDDPCPTCSGTGSNPENAETQT